MRGRGWGALVAAGASALVTALLVGLPMPSAQAASVVVFPDVEDINPKITPYSITVNDPGSASNLVARWQVAQSLGHADFREMLLPHEGTIALPFAETFAHNYVTPVWIYRCVNPTWSADSCVTLETSPYVNVWVESATYLDYYSKTVSPEAQTVEFTYDPPGLGTSTWRLLAADGSVLLAGQTPLAPGGKMTLAIPPGTPEQVGTLEVISSLDGTVVGHLDGHLRQSFGIDGVAPPVPEVSLSASVVYPHDDDYLDSVMVTVLTPDADSVELQAINEASGVTHPLGEEIAGSDQPQTLEFDGRSRTSTNTKRLPSGTYRIRVISSDWGGKSAVFSEPIEVRGDRLEAVKWRRTVPAAKTVIKKNVGNCGRLRTPAEPGWRGSLGYYAGACPPKRAYVQAIHAMKLPPSKNGRYTGLRVSLAGGANRKQPGSYLVLGYYTNDKKWVFKHREVFRGRGVHVHHGHQLAVRETKKYLQTGKSGHYVAWSTGLSTRSRFDVKSFTVEIYRTVLVPEPQ